MKVDATTKINNNSVGDYSSRFGKVKYNNDTYVLIEKAYYCIVDGFDKISVPQAHGFNRGLGTVYE